MNFLLLILLSSFAKAANIDITKSCNLEPKNHVVTGYAIAQNLDEFVAEGYLKTYLEQGGELDYKLIGLATWKFKVSKSLESLARNRIWNEKNCTTETSDESYESYSVNTGATYDNEQFRFDVTCKVPLDAVERRNRICSQLINCQLNAVIDNENVSLLAEINKKISELKCTAK